MGLASIILVSCKSKPDNRNVSHNKLPNIQIDFRFGNKFYSLHLDEKGNAYVDKGESSYYTEPFQVLSYSRSETFKVDSIDNLVGALSSIKDPVMGKAPMGTTPRVEMYYRKRKVYDAYRWNDTMWGFFFPVIGQLPKGFNPFRLDEQPYGMEIE